MPVYNIPPALLIEAVESVRALGVAHELIVVDDGSTDHDTQEALLALRELESAPIVIRQDNAGVASARNAGIAAATQDWVTFIDADDRCRAEMAGVISALAECDNDLVVSAGAGITMAGEETEAYDLATVAGEQSGTDLLEQMMRLYVHGRCSASFILGVPWAKFVRRTVLIDGEVRFTDGLVKRSDAEWLVRLYQHVRRVTVVNTKTVDYRLDVPGNISRRFRPEVLEAFETLRVTASTAPVSDEARQMYSVELIKDAINSVFSSPTAVAPAGSREAYRAFRGRFDMPESLLRSGALQSASAPRKALYVAIKRGWFTPVLMLRMWKSRAQAPLRSWGASG